MRCAVQAAAAPRRCLVFRSFPQLVRHPIAVVVCYLGEPHSLPESNSQHGECAILPPQVVRRILVDLEFAYCYVLTVTTSLRD